MIPLMVDLPVDQNGWIMLLTILLIFPSESGGFEQIRGKVRIQIGNEKTEKTHSEDCRYITKS